MPQCSAAALGVTLTLCVITGPGCSDSPSGPSTANPALTETTTSVHYTIHSAPGDTVNTVWQDAYYEWLVAALQLQPSARLDYYKDRDRPRWSGTDLHVLARQYDAAGRLPTLASLLRSSDFFSFDPDVMYPCAGSFVRYGIDSRGLTPLKKYFATATFDDAASTTESRFLAAYGRPLTAAWNEWLAWLRSPV